MTEKTYINVTQEAGKAFMMRGIEGPVTMLNLLRFREVADYSAHPELAPEEPISGEAAFQLYMENTRPVLQAVEGAVTFEGSGGPWLIGPESAQWDKVLLVRHRSVADFLGLAQNPDFLKGAGHRTAALADSRLLPILVAEDSAIS